MNLRLELDGLRILGLRASLGFRFRARDGLGLAKFGLKPVGLLKFALKLGCNGKVKGKLIVIKKGFITQDLVLLSRNISLIGHFGSS